MWLSPMRLELFPRCRGVHEEGGRQPIAMIAIFFNIAKSRRLLAQMDFLNSNSHVLNPDIRFIEMQRLSRSLLLRYIGISLALVWL